MSYILRTRNAALHQNFMNMLLNGQVPIYQFKQPDRLNPKQLPFKIVRMKSIELSGIHFFSVDSSMASDSWFPGYSCRV